MTISYSATVKKAKLDQIETTITTAPIQRVYDGTQPTDADTALDDNTLLAEGTLPSDWMAAAGNSGNTATKAKNGTWTITGQSGASTGTAGTFFRIYASDGTTCHVQGTFGASGTDMTVDNNSIANGQSINVSTFTLTGGN